MIVIDPLVIDNLGPNSIDVTLGQHFWMPDPEWQIHHFEYDPYDEVNVRDYWSLYTLFPNEKMILTPGQTVLAHTRETVGSMNIITSEMRARSSIGRSGIIVCACAGSGDVGFVSRWTMEIRNTLNVPVVLRQGMRIAQITFDYTGEVERPYTGKYGQKEWTPQDMLPKLWLDREARSLVGTAK